MTIVATRTAPRTRNTRSSRRLNFRSLIGPLGAIITILLANVVYGATLPMASLFFSGCMMVCAILSVTLSGPRHATIAMAMAPCIVFTLAAVGAFGPIRAAAPDAAVLLGMTSAWTIGFVAARHRSTIDVLWTGLVWALLLYTIWVFFTQIGSTFDAIAGLELTAGLGSPGEAAVMFGFFSLIGSARVMHVIKQMDARALSRSEMVDRLLRDGLGGMLLLGFALTCLAMTGSRVGILFTCAVVFFHSWWDLRAILTRDHRSAWVQVLERLTPVGAAVAVGLGFFLAMFRDESVVLNAAGAAPNTHAQRVQVYWDAFLEQPLFGHGIGQIEVLTDRITTLYNYVALGAYGDAQNVALNWLVETGIAGAAIAAAMLVAAHVSLMRAFRNRGVSRGLPRLAVMSSALMLFHGLADSSLALPSMNWTYALILGCACGVAAMHAMNQADAKR